ncbi:MAG: hypothetical protein KJ559_02425 [Nanoarchaeota archaeon]|nr:hypothetical protein [Nanoarchaeota archaeon]
MKKSLLFVLICLFMFPLVLAIETTIKENYNQGETLIAEISGNFIDNIKPNDIEFYSGRAYIPLIYDLGKINEKFYLYALLPIKERNYTLIIKNLKHFELGKEVEEDLSLNFSVKNNVSLFSVNPGFIITNQDFSIKIMSNIKKINLVSKFLNSSQEISIDAGKEKQIYFSVSDIKSSIISNVLIEAENEKYEIPIFVFKEYNDSDKLVFSKDLRFVKSYLNFTTLKDSYLKFEVSLINIGQGDIEDIKIDFERLEDVLESDVSSIDKLKAGEIIKINMTINSNEEGIKEGDITAKSGNHTATSFISIRVTKDNQEFLDIMSSSGFAEEESCSYFNGEICATNENCDGSLKVTIDGVCCVGLCIQKKESNLTKIILLIAISAVLLAIGYFGYKKLKTKSKGSKDILDERKEKYEKRFEIQKSKETRGALDRN